MKAREYVKQFIQEGSNARALWKVFIGMMGEAAELAYIRRARERDAFITILDQTYDKWKAFARQIGIKPEVFFDLHKEKFPGAHEIWMSVRSKTRP